MKMGERCCFEATYTFGELLWLMVFDVGDNLTAKVHDGYTTLATASVDKERSKGGKTWYRVDALPYGTVKTTKSSFHSDPDRAVAAMKREAQRTFLVAFDAMERHRMSRRDLMSSPQRGENGRFPHQPLC